MKYCLTHTFLLLLFCVLPFKGQSQNEPTLNQLIDRRQYTAVIDKVETLTASDSADLNTMHSIGQAFEGLLRYRKAYDYYSYCLNQDTTNIDYINALARTAIYIGKVKEAENLFHKVLKADSLNFYANNQLARLYYQIREYDKAIERYNILIDHNEQNPSLLTSLGDCYSKKEQYFPAVTSYFLAYNINRENASLASNLINSMLHLGGEYINEAITICDTALYYNPDNKFLLQNKGMALYMNKNYAEADTLYTSLMETGDSTYITLKYGGICRYHAGQYLRAIEPLEAALTLDTTSVDICIYLGSALGKTYDRKRALALFQKAEENMQPPKSYLTQIKMFRAETYMKNADYRVAEKMYYELWNELPDRIDFLGQIDKLYPTDIFTIKDEKQLQRALFIKILYTKQALEKDVDKDFLFFRHGMLEKIYNEMFFRQIESMSMLAPDGKTSKISILDIREIMNQLPNEKTN